MSTDHAPDHRHARPRGRARARDLDRGRRTHRHRGAAPHHPRRTRLRRPDAVPARAPRRARPHDVARRGRHRRARAAARGTSVPRRPPRADAGDHPVRHVRAVRPAADAPPRHAHDHVPPPAGGGRPHRRLPPAPARPEAVRGRGVPRSAVPGDRRRRLVQRHRDARRSRPRVPVPRPRQRAGRVPAVPGRRRVRRPAATSSSASSERARRRCRAGTLGRCATPRAPSPRPTA